MSRPPPGLRAQYRVFGTVTTRWMDNDAFGHINNVHYYSYIDTAVCQVMVRHGILTWQGGPHFMMAAESGCRFLGEAAFPDRLDIGVRVARLGTSSVRWEAGVFRDGTETACAEGFMVHVCVDSQARRPAPLPAPWRTALEAFNEQEPEERP